MTDWDQEIAESPLFTGASVQLYRLTRREYATLSGAGSARYPGRWNQPGERAVYTSLERSTPVLERMVHTSKLNIPSNLAMMSIRVEGNWRRQDQSLVDERTGGTILFCKSLKAASEFAVALAGSSWNGMRPIAVALPSVILPVWNVILYPAAPGFRTHVSLVEIEPFTFDPRLFHDDAILES